MNYVYNHNISYSGGKISPSGGTLVFELFSQKVIYTDTSEVIKKRAIINRVFSMERNFTVSSLNDREDAIYEVRATFKPLNEVSWRNGEDCRQGRVPIMFEVFDEEEQQTRLFETQLYYLGNLKDYMRVDGCSVITDEPKVLELDVLSFKEVVNNQAIKLSVTPEIDVPDDENISIELIETPSQSEPLNDFKFRITLNEPIQDIQGIDYDELNSVYSIPIVIKQKEYTYDTTNPPITPETAYFITYNLIVS